MPTPDDSIRSVIAELLRQRRSCATICPSEAARVLAPNAWRPLMHQVRTVAVAMAREGVLEIRQGGRVVPPDEPLRGPIRLARKDASDG